MKRVNVAKMLNRIQESDYFRVDGINEACDAFDNLMDKIDSYLKMGHSDTAYREIKDAAERVKGERDVYSV